MIDIYKDLGFGNNLEKSGLFDSTPTNAQSNFSQGVSSSVIGSGGMSANVTLVDGYIQSKNFSEGSNGWRIDKDGNVEFNNGNFRGDISGASGTFSGSIRIMQGANVVILLEP